MKKIITGLILLFITNCNITFSQYINELYLGSVTVNFGSPGVIKIRMKNTAPANAFQVSVTLPASVSYQAGSVALDTSRKKDHVITVSVLTGNILKIISYSPTNQTYLGTDSSIASFRIIAATNPGTYSVPLSGGIISDTNGLNILSNVYSGSILVKTPVISLPASIVFDTTSYTDTTRKQLTIQNTGTDTLRITGINASEPSFTNETVLPVRISPGSSGLFTIRFANSNKGLHTGTLQISHSDSLRNPGSVAVSGFIYKPTRLHVTSTDLLSRDTNYIPFGVNNTQPFVAFQFDVTLPPQTAFIPNSAILTPRANGHQVYTSVLANGDIRVIAFSMNQNKFTGDTGDVVKLMIAINADTGIYPVSIKNVIISDSNNTNISTGLDNGFIRVNPYPPLLVSPPNGSVGNPVNLNLVWRRSPFAATYHLQFAIDSLFTNKIINDSTYTDSTRTMSNLTPLTNYYWRVRIKYFSGASRFSNFWAFRTIGQPMIPQCVYPPQDTVNMPLNITFLWRKTADQMNINNVNQYWFELSPDSLFTNPVRDTTLSDTLKTVNGLQNNTKYYWRIKAKNEIGWSSYSYIWRFTTIPPLPSAPVLVSPADNSTGNPVSLTLVWNKVQYAAAYRVLLSTDSLFNSLVLNDSTVADSTRSVSGLSNLTSYWWKVSAKNVAGTSAYSLTFKFTTAPPPPATVSLKVIPGGFYDPNTGTLRMRDTINVYLVDSATCMRLDSNKVVLDSVTFSAALSFSNAPTGNYYLYVYHRNHLPVASMYRQNIVRGSNLNYDLTADSAKTFGLNVIKVSNSPVRWGMIPGDANRDEFIDGLDQTIWIGQNGFDGYLAADFNGDGFVDGLDQTIWILYNGNSSYLPCMTPLMNIDANKVKTLIKKENLIYNKKNY